MAMSVRDWLLFAGAVLVLLFFVPNWLAKWAFAGALVFFLIPDNMEVGLGEIAKLSWGWWKNRVIALKDRIQGY